MGGCLFAFFAVKVVSPFDRPFCPFEDAIGAALLSLGHLLSGLSFMLSIGLVHLKEWRSVVLAFGLVAATTTMFWLYAMSSLLVFPVHLSWLLLVAPVFFGIVWYIRKSLDETASMIVDLKGNMYEFKSL